MLWVQRQIACGFCSAGIHASALTCLLFYLLSCLSTKKALSEGASAKFSKWIKWWRKTNMRLDIVVQTLPLNFEALKVTSPSWRLFLNLSSHTDFYSASAEVILRSKWWICCSSKPLGLEPGELVWISARLLIRCGTVSSHVQNGGYIIHITFLGLAVL